jgi:hypothetical protein
MQTLLRSLVLRRPAKLRRKAGAARGAVLTGVLFALALNLGLGTAAERNPAVRDPGYGDKLKQLHALTANNPRPLVVALGTSRTGFGFDGLKFEAKAGQECLAYNFGVPASGPITHLLYWQRLQAAGVKPTQLILEVLPSMLGEQWIGPVEGHWLTGDRFTYDELTIAAEYGLDGEKLRSEWREATLTPWYGLRFQILGRYVQSWIPWHRRHAWGRGLDARGFSTPMVPLATPEQRAEGEARAANEYGLTLAALQPTGRATLALERCIREAQDAGVRVTLVWMPEGSSFRKLYPPACERAVYAFLNQLCERRGCTFVDARTWIPDEQFSDGHHPMRGGAALYSERLAEMLVPTRGQP